VAGRKVPNLPLTQVMDALTLFEGCVPLAAQHLGISTTKLRDRIRYNKRLQDLVASKRQEIVDIAELSLRRKAMDGEGWAVMFALRTLGVASGLPYSDRQQIELSGPQGRPIETNSQLSIQHVIAAFIESDDCLERARREALSVPPAQPPVPSLGLSAPSLPHSDPGLSGGNGKQRKVDAGPAPPGDRPGSSPLHPGEPSGNGQGAHPPD
jgi:hypothetical protein